MTANPARGEVEVIVDGETFVLAPEMEALAIYQGAMAVQGLGPLAALVIAMDMRAIFNGLKCLAIKGDVSKVDKLSYAGGGLIKVQAALMKVFEAMSEPDPKKDNGAASQTPTT